MSELEDAQEFADATAKYEEASGSVAQNKAYASPPSLMGKDKDEKPTPGQVTQYALYGRGYKATTPTIPSLPAGCYDIEVDNAGVYVVPTPDPTGLLLELPEMRSEEVIGLVENFWDSEKDYKEGNEYVIGGANYKAGIMLYGPPGTGKSTTIKLVCKKLIKRGGTVFYASGHPSYIQKFLTDFTTVEKNRKCIVILEDIDTLIHNYGESQYLEMLDSAKSIDNVLFIATTNYADRLDPRIYNRPGRFSSVIKIGLPGKAARRAFLKAILKKHDHVDYIVDKSDGFSIDHLSSLMNSIYREKKNMETEIERLRTLFKIPKSDDKEMGIAVGMGMGSND